MKAIKKFLITSLFGGFVVLVSVAIPLAVVQVLLNIVAIFTGPLVSVIVGGATINVYLAKALEIIVALVLCFSVGILVKTRLGRAAENAFIKRIIFGYSVLKESFLQLYDLLSKKKGYLSPALFYPYGRGCSEKIGFIASYPRAGYATCVELKAGINGFGDYHTLPNRLVFPLSGFTLIDVLRIAAVGGAGTTLPMPEDIPSLEELVARGERP